MVSEAPSRFFRRLAKRHTPRRHFGLWFACGLMCTAFAAQAQTSLWRISKGDQFIYLGAAIHALGPADYPLPIAFEAAYRRANTLIVESDLGATMTRSGRNRLLRAAMYTDGTRLQDHLRPETWDALRVFVESRSRTMDSVARFKPGMLGVILTMIARDQTGPSPNPGVDAHFLAAARRDGKNIGSLETLAQQIFVFAALGQDDPDSVVMQALHEVSQPSEAAASAATAWRQGDLAWLEQNLLAPLQRYPAVYKSLIVDRNLAWLPAIEAMFESEPVELVLVGALHLLGPDSVLALLQAKGYRFEQL